jgi:hypothetical protein
MAKCAFCGSETNGHVNVCLLPSNAMSQGTRQPAKPNDPCKPTTTHRLARSTATGLERVSDGRLDGLAGKGGMPAGLAI